MNQLLIKADVEEVNISISDNFDVISSKQWKAGKELSNQIFDTINEICKSANTNLDNLEGIIVYQGPGSYTGLRISISVANALGYSLGIPVAGSTGVNWDQDGLNFLQHNSKFTPISPVYGGEVYTTKPIK